MKRHTNNDAAAHNVPSDYNEHRPSHTSEDQGLGLVEGSEFIFDDVFEFDAPQFCDFVKEKTNFNNDPVEDGWFQQVHWLHESKERQIEEAIRNLPFTAPSSSSTSSHAPNAPKSFFLFSRGGFASRNNTNNNVTTTAVTAATTTTANAKTSPGGTVGVQTNVLSPSSNPSSSSQSSSLSPLSATANATTISPSIFSHHNINNHNTLTNTNATHSVLSPPLSSSASSSLLSLHKHSEEGGRRDSLLEMIEQHNRQLQQQDERRDSLLELIEQHNRLLQQQPLSQTTDNSNMENSSPLSSLTLATTLTIAPTIASITGKTHTTTATAATTTTNAPKTSTATTSTATAPTATQVPPSLPKMEMTIATATTSPFDNIMNSLVTDFFNDDDDDALMDGIYNLNFPENNNHKNNNNNNNKKSSRNENNGLSTIPNNISNNVDMPNRVATQPFHLQQQHSLPAYLLPQTPSQPQQHQAPPALPAFTRHHSRQPAPAVPAISLVSTDPITSLTDLPDTFYPVHTSVSVAAPSSSCSHASTSSVSSTTTTARTAGALQRSNSNTSTLHSHTLTKAASGGLSAGTSVAGKGFTSTLAPQIYEDSSDEVFVTYTAPSITLAKSVYGPPSSSSSSTSLATKNKLAKTSSASLSSTTSSAPVGKTTTAATATTTKKSINTAPTNTTAKSQPLQLLNNTIHTREKGESVAHKATKGVSTTSSTTTAAPAKKITQADIMDDELAAMLAEHNKRFKPKSSYEPRKYSVKEVKMWETMSGKKWHDCNTEEKEQANQWMEQQRTAAT